MMVMNALPVSGYNTGMSLGVGLLAIIVYAFVLSTVISIFLNLIFGISLLNHSLKGEDTAKQKKRLRNSLVYTLIIYALLFVGGFIGSFIK